MGRYVGRHGARTQPGPVLLEIEPHPIATRPDGRMEPDLTVLASLRKAVEAMPDDVPLRVHLATLLLQAGQRDEAIRHVGAVLQRDPGNTEALALLQRPAAPPAAPDAGAGAGARPAHRARHG